MKAKILDTKIICENKHSAHNYFGWPTVAKLRDGKIMVGASGFRVRHVCPYGKAVVCTSYDDGETWTPPTVVIDTLIDDRDVGITPFGDSSVMVMSLSDSMEYINEFYGAIKDESHPRFDRFGKFKDYSLAYAEFVKDKENVNEFLGSNFRVSHDNGLTFGPIHNVPPMIPHGPCVLPDGRIFAMGNTRGDGIHYDRFLSSYIINPDTGECELVSKIYSDDFITEDVIACEPYTIVTKSGKMIVHIRVENSDMSIKTTYQCESYDLGKTFTKPHKLFDDDTGATPTHILQHSSGALIAVHAWRKESGIDAMVSTDDGETWEKGLEIYRNEELLDWSYPSSCELSDGSILTVFYADPEGEPNSKACSVMAVKWRLEK